MVVVYGIPGMVLYYYCIDFGDCRRVRWMMDEVGNKIMGRLVIIHSVNALFPRYQV